ncbi:hypothetical protein K8I28_05270 [bacterium]|nr:hypothetical protein [bacterium]
MTVDGNRHIDKTKQRGVINIPVDQIHPGPIRHPEMPEWFLIEAQAVHDIVKDVFDMSLDEFLLNFQRDSDPSHELGVWKWIATKYSEIISSPLVSRWNRKSIFNVIFDITVQGVAETSTSEVGDLSRTEVKAIVDYCIRDRKD